MSFEHNSLKNLFLLDSYCNGLFHRVMERDVSTPIFAKRKLRKAWKTREMDLDHDLNDITSIIEWDEWDVGVHTERNILLYTGVCPGFKGEFGDINRDGGVTFCCDDEDDDVMMSVDLDGEGLTINVDVLTTLGEEYPRILRGICEKMDEDEDEGERYALVVDQCTVESCSWEDLVDIFDSHGIALVSFKEILN